MLVSVPAAPAAIVILPLLLGLVYWGLRQSQMDKADGSLLATLAGPAMAWNYLSLLALPGTGVAVYALAMVLDLQWRTNWVLYLVTTPLGFILFATSMYQIIQSNEN